MISILRSGVSTSGETDMIFISEETSVTTGENELTSGSTDLTDAGISSCTGS